MNPTPLKWLARWLDATANDPDAPLSPAAYRVARWLWMGQGTLAIVVGLWLAPRMTIIILTLLGMGWTIWRARRG